MMWLLKMMLLGHAHRWKVIKTIDLKSREGADIGTRYHLQCETCGDVKKRDLD